MYLSPHIKIDPETADLITEEEAKRQMALHQSYAILGRSLLDTLGFLPPDFDWNQLDIDSELDTLERARTALMGSDPVVESGAVDALDNFAQKCVNEEFGETTPSP